MPASRYGWVFGDTACARRDARAALRAARHATVVVARVECAPPSAACACPPGRVIWQYDATPVLRQFAREVALDVAHLWNAPPVVLRYLKTGDESIRDTAWADTAAVIYSAGSVAGRAALSAISVDIAGGAHCAAVSAATAIGGATRGGVAAQTAARHAAGKRQGRRLGKMLIAGQRVYGQRAMP